MSSQALLSREDRVEVDIDPDDEGTPHKSIAHRPAMIAFIWGVFITSAALALHYSGLEPVDLSYQDDVCYSGPALQVQGMNVDACMVRQSATQGTDCGKPAANAYCKLMEANYMVNFTLAEAPKSATYGTITLGNSFLGGRISFSEICCDVGSYQPAWSRILLLLGGTLLLYAAARVTARLALRSLEVFAAWLHLDAGEVLYSLLGLEGPVRWLLFSLTLVSWVDWTLWEVWCGAGVDCEAHGSEARQTARSAAEVLVLFSLGALCAKAAPRVISVRYLYAGEFAKVRATMRNEGLLDALTQPEVREVIEQRRQERQTAAAAAGAVTPAPGAASSTPTGQQHHNGAGHHRRSSKGGDKTRHMSTAAASGAVKEFSSILTSGWTAGSAVDRFRSFLDRYSTLSEEEVAEQAQAQGAQLYENLLGVWDLDLDGTVGRDDFLELFRKVGAPSGFKTPTAAARAAWALFDLDQDGRLGKAEFTRALAALYQERANTARTVLSNESAVRSLETAIGTVLYTLLLFAAARILGLATADAESGQSQLDYFTTYVLALSFIFGDTVRSIFRSTLYLFAEQPYSVGDYLELDDELWMVVSFDLLFTQLRKWEYNQFAKIPNDQLMDSKLVNVSRGGCFKDTVLLSAPLALATDSIREIKAKLLEAGAERPKDIIPDSPHIKIDSIETGQTMMLMLEWVYAFPPGDRQRVDDTREFMVAKCKEALVAVGVTDQELKLNFKLAAGKTKK